MLVNFMGFGGGFLLAAALLELVPESLEGGDSLAPLLIVAGYLLVYIFEHLFATHAHTDQPLLYRQEAAENPAYAGPNYDPSSYDPENYPADAHDLSHHTLIGSLPHVGELITRRASLAALVGLLVHTFFDGLAIVAGFLTSPALGTLVFIAVFLHKVPEGFSIATIMRAAAHSRGIAFLSATALAASTVLGATVPFLIGVPDPEMLRGRLALAAGTFIYVAASDLIPAVSPQSSRTTYLFVFVGVAAFYTSKLLAHSVLG